MSPLSLVYIKTHESVNHENLFGIQVPHLKKEAKMLNNMQKNSKNSVQEIGERDRRGELEGLPYEYRLR